MDNTKKHIYRVGDKVRIVNPQFILRVGYPLVFKDLIPEFENHPNLQKAMVLLGLSDEHEQINTRSRLVRDFIAGCAKAAVRHRGFGGCERKIFYRSEDEPVLFLTAINPDNTPDFVEVDVLSKRTVKTGTYYPPHSGYSYEGEYDYEPGGLTDEKTHILLSTIYGEIEETDVEPV